MRAASPSVVVADVGVRMGGEGHAAPSPFPRGGPGSAPLPVTLGLPEPCPSTPGSVGYLQPELGGAPGAGGGHLQGRPRWERAAAPGLVWGRGRLALSRPL